MRLLILSPDEESISPQQAIEQAKNQYGAFATIIAMPSSNNTYAQLYFCAQALLAESIGNILVDTKDSEYYNIEKHKLIEQAVTQFREVLEEVISDTEEKFSK